MRSRGLLDHELRDLLVPAAAAGPDLRAQVAVALLVEAGVPPRDLAGLTTVAALRLRMAPTPPLPGDLLAALDRQIEATGDQPYLLGGPRPLAMPGLRWLCRRFGERRGVPGVTPERLRRTWLRRLAAREGLAEAARRAGVGEGTVRRQLAGEHEAPAASRPGVWATRPAGAGSASIRVSFGQVRQAVRE